MLEKFLVNTIEIDVLMYWWPNNSVREAVTHFQHWMIASPSRTYFEKKLSSSNWKGKLDSIRLYVDFLIQLYKVIGA